MADIQIRVSQEVYDKVLALAQEHRRTIKAQFELLIEKGMS